MKTDNILKYKFLENPFKLSLIRNSPGFVPNGAKVDLTDAIYENIIDKNWLNTTLLLQMTDTRIWIFPEPIDIIGKGMNHTV